jgi:capsule biosynthesis phosphatase
VTDNSRFRIVMDVDGTLAEPKPEGGTYPELAPNDAVVERLRQYKQQGFYIIIQSSRNMRTFNNNLGLLQANTLPTLIEWLNRHDIPFDEVHVGKPWCGFDGFYVDDRAIRPDEFVSKSFDEIRKMMGETGA